MNRLGLRNAGFLLRPSRTLSPALLSNRRFASTSKSGSEASSSLFGDYPEVEPKYAQHRDPYATYDDQQNRRNFNEPLHPYNEMYDVWSPDRFDIVNDWVPIRNNVLFALGILGFASYIYYFAAPEKPAVQRDYPHDGLLKALGGNEEQKYNQARVDNSIA